MCTLHIIPVSLCRNENKSACLVIYFNQSYFFNFISEISRVFKVPLFPNFSENTFSEKARNQIPILKKIRTEYPLADLQMSLYLVAFSKFHLKHISWKILLTLKCYFYAGGSLEMFMTDDQKKYYAAMKKMGNKKPVKATPRPRVSVN